MDTRLLASRGDEKLFPVRIGGGLAARYRLWIGNRCTESAPTRRSRFSSTDPEVCKHESGLRYESGYKNSLQLRKWITSTKVEYKWITAFKFDVYCYVTMKELEGDGGGVT
jgi:hypothetical protein